ncbi:hypothetical protein [Streptomyces abyssomicinicus]|uniref:hypothetical protein n=1 Tax=Streptomyces abyssomicinicus TaxID=574929 RepID=UPI003F77265E
MSIRTTYRALLSRLLPDDRPDDLAVRQGQFHTVVIGSDRVVCLPRTRVLQMVTTGIAEEPGWRDFVMPIVQGPLRPAVRHPDRRPLWGL